MLANNLVTESQVLISHKLRSIVSSWSSGSKVGIQHAETNSRESYKESQLAPEFPAI